MNISMEESELQEIHDYVMKNIENIGNNSDTTHANVHEGISSFAIQHPLSSGSCHSYCNRITDAQYPKLKVKFKFKSSLVQKCKQVFLCKWKTARDMLSPQLNRNNPITDESHIKSCRVRKCSQG